MRSRRAEASSSSRDTASSSRVELSGPVKHALPVNVAPFGCSQCFAEEAATAWAASRTTRVVSLVEESHFSLQVTACSCGQRFVSVFTERIDWVGGEDDQTWLVVALTSSEAQQLETTPPEQLPTRLSSYATGRRFLVRSFPTGGALSTWWRENGFSIGPHD